MLSRQAAQIVAGSTEELLLSLRTRRQYSAGFVDSTVDNTMRMGTLT